ncbi:hypothetical protein cyc_06078 [Cyclospora cayetanensis]|uniref:Uncharacterized protein n=1 Tax=Cyclospora cayetanensis TaxID=88456 RepID=A0A1D3D054_9EIME|nr:hypothetical protein cyc_06078 [Cyclospora cayetanensis]
MSEEAAGAAASSRIGNASSPLTPASTSPEGGPLRGAKQRAWSATRQRRRHLKKEQVPPAAQGESAESPSVSQRCAPPPSASWYSASAAESAAACACGVCDGSYSGTCVGGRCSLAGCGVEGDMEVDGEEQQAQEQEQPLLCETCEGRDFCGEDDEESSPCNPGEETPVVVWGRCLSSDGWREEHGSLSSSDESVEWGVGTVVSADRGTHNDHNQSSSSNPTPTPSPPFPQDHAACSSVCAHARWSFGEDKADAVEAEPWISEAVRYMEIVVEGSSSGVDCVELTTSPSSSSAASAACTNSRTRYKAPSEASRSLDLMPQHVAAAAAATLAEAGGGSRRARRKTATGDFAQGRAADASEAGEAVVADVSHGVSLQEVHVLVLKLYQELQKVAAQVMAKGSSSRMPTRSDCSKPQQERQQETAAAAESKGPAVYAIAAQRYWSSSSSSGLKWGDQIKRRSWPGCMWKPKSRESKGSYSCCGVPLCPHKLAAAKRYMEQQQFPQREVLYRQLPQKSIVPTAHYAVQEAQQEYRLEQQPKASTYREALASAKDAEASPSARKREDSEEESLAASTPKERTAAKTAATPSAKAAGAAASAVELESSRKMPAFVGPSTGCYRSAADWCAGCARVQRQLLLFNSSTEPPLSLGQYITRLQHLACATEHELLMALLLLTRVQQRQQQLRISKRNAHRLLLAALVLVSKVVRDDHTPLALWAVVGGVSSRELASLEMALLELVGHRVSFSLPDGKVEDEGDGKTPAALTGTYELVENDATSNGRFSASADEECGTNSTNSERSDPNVDFPQGAANRGEESGLPLRCTHTAVPRPALKTNPVLRRLMQLQGGAGMRPETLHRGLREGQAKQQGGQREEQKGAGRGIRAATGGGIQTSLGGCLGESPPVCLCGLMTVTFLVGASEVNVLDVSPLERRSGRKQPDRRRSEAHGSCTTVVTIPNISSPAKETFYVIKTVYNSNPSNVKIHQDKSAAGGLSASEVRSIWGQPSDATFANVSESHFACLDDRVTAPSLYTPGGDLGEFALALTACGTAPNDAIILQILNAYVASVPGTRKFYHCTDDEALEHMESYLGVEGLDMFSPDPPTQAEITKALEQPRNVRFFALLTNTLAAHPIVLHIKVGDVHFRSMMKNPGWYDLPPKESELVLAAPRDSCIFL